MTTDCITALLQPFLDRELSTVQLNQISIYIDILRRWNSRINLTAIRAPEEILRRHFGESFFLARHLFPVSQCGGHSCPPPAVPVRRGPHPLAHSASEGARQRGPVHVLDIGSGAGFPGLPLKIWDPSIAVTLVESNHKKATFLREVVRTLTLTDVNVMPVRAETLLPHPGSSVARAATGSTLADIPADVVTLRAVERFESVLPTAANLVRPGGRLALLISSGQVPALHSLDHYFKSSEPVPIPKAQSRVLIILVHTCQVE